MPSKIILGYWDLRGYAQPIRLMLSYNGEDWEDKLYTCGPAPEWNSDSWLNEKFTLGLDFPNIPYLFDGDVKMSQSNAIMRYLGRKHNQMGKTEQERIRVDVMENQIMDFRSAFVTMMYSPDFEKLKGPYLEALPGKLKAIANFLGTRNFLAGETVTYVDFIVYEIFDHHRSFVPNCLSSFQNLEGFMERVEGLKGVAEFLKSSRCIKFPFNGPMAAWGGRDSKQ